MTLASDFGLSCKHEGLLVCQCASQCGQETVGGPFGERLAEVPYIFLVL